MQTMQALILACKHKPVPTSAGGTGYGTWIPSGEQLCYACLDMRQLQAIENGSRRFCGYVDSDGLVTTWSGGKLGRIIYTRVGPIRRTGYRMTYVRAVVIGGRKFFGQYNADSGNAVSFRAMA